MAAGSYERKQFTGGAQPTSLNAAISGSPSSFTVSTSGGASFPDGSIAPFVVVIDRNTATEEKILVTTRVGDQFNIATRGYDDTSAINHDIGAIVEHVLDASTIDQTNRYVNLQTSVGDLISHDGTNAVALSIGANNTLLVADSAASEGIAWKSFATLDLATETYVDTQIGIEETARINADNTLQTNIDAKQNAATALTTSTTFAGDVTGLYNSLNIEAGSVGNAEFRDSAGLSIVGRSANSTGDVADILAASDHHVLRRSGTSIGFGTITGSAISSATITGSNIAAATIAGSNIAAATITGSNIGSSTITSTNLADDCVNSSEIVDGAVDEVHLSNTLCAELTLTAINGWSGTIYYWILGNMVFGQVAITNGIGSATSQTFATLPSGYRPQRLVRFGAAASASREFTINTSGSMSCSTANTYFDGSFHFLIN